MKRLAVLLFVVGMWQAPIACGEDVLFEDAFDHGLSEKWQIVKVSPGDYRVRDGALELRIDGRGKGRSQPMLKVDLPFTTSDTVVASVEISVVGERLGRGEQAGLCLTDQSGMAFSVRKTNIDGYFVLAPGEVDFIGKPGEEGDPGKYTVKYWPADSAFGPLRVLVRGDYAHFQVGPSADDKYRTYFHSAIEPAKEGLGFGLYVRGVDDEAGERWVRFDNFRVTKL